MLDKASMQKSEKKALYKNQAKNNSDKLKKLVANQTNNNNKKPDFQNQDKNEKTIFGSLTSKNRTLNTTTSVSKTLEGEEFGYSKEFADILAETFNLNGSDDKVIDEKEQTSILQAINEIRQESQEEETDKITDVDSIRLLNSDDKDNNGIADGIDKAYRTYYQDNIEYVDGLNIDGTENLTDNQKITLSDFIDENSKITKHGELITCTDKNGKSVVIDNFGNIVSHNGPDSEYLTPEEIEEAGLVYDDKKDDLSTYDSEEATPEEKKTITGSISETITNNPETAAKILIRNYDSEEDAAQALQSCLDNSKFHNICPDAEVSFESGKFVVTYGKNNEKINIEDLLKLNTNEPLLHEEYYKGLYTYENYNNDYMLALGKYFSSALSETGLTGSKIADQQTSLKNLAKISTIEDSIKYGTELAGLIQNSETQEDLYNSILAYSGGNIETSNTVFQYLLINCANSFNMSLEELTASDKNPFNGRNIQYVMDLLYTNQGDKYVLNQNLLNKFASYEKTGKLDEEKNPILRQTSGYYTNLNGDICTLDYNYEAGKTENGDIIYSLTFNENGTTRSLNYYEENIGAKETIYHVLGSKDEFDGETEEEFLKRLVVMSAYGNSINDSETDKVLSTNEINERYAVLKEYDSNNSVSLSALEKEFSSQGIPDDIKNWFSNITGIGMGDEQVIKEVGAETLHAIILSEYMNGNTQKAQEMAEELFDSRLQHSATHDELYKELMAYYQDSDTVLKIMNSSAVTSEYARVNLDNNGKIKITTPDNNTYSDMPLYGNKISLDKIKEANSNVANEKLTQEQAYSFLTYGGKYSNDAIIAYHTAQEKYTDYNLSVAGGIALQEAKTPEDTFKAITGKDINEATEEDINKYNEFYNIDNSALISYDLLLGSYDWETDSGKRYYQLSYQYNKNSKEFEVVYRFEGQDAKYLSLDNLQNLPYDIWNKIDSIGSINDELSHTINSSSGYTLQLEKQKFEEFYSNNQTAVDNYIKQYASFAETDAECKKYFAKKLGIKESEVNKETVSNYILENKDNLFNESCNYMQFAYTEAKQNLYGNSRLDEITNQYITDMATYSSNFSHALSMGCMAASVLFPAAAPVLMMGAKAAGYTDNAIDLVNMLTNRQNYNDDDYLGWAKSTGFEWVTKHGYMEFSNVAGDLGQKASEWVIDNTGKVGSFFARNAIAQIALKGTSEALIETGICIPFTMAIKAIQGGKYDLIDELKENFIYDFLPYARGWQDILIGDINQPLYSGDGNYYRIQGGNEIVKLDPDNNYRTMAIYASLEDSKNKNAKPLAEYNYDYEGKVIITENKPDKTQDIRIHEGNKIIHCDSVSDDGTPEKITSVEETEKLDNGKYKTTVKNAQGEEVSWEIKDSKGNLISESKNGITTEYTKSGRPKKITGLTATGENMSVEYSSSWGKISATVKIADSEEMTYSIDSEGKAVYENESGEKVSIDESRLLQMAQTGTSIEVIKTVMSNTSSNANSEVSTEKPVEEPEKKQAISEEIDEITRIIDETGDKVDKSENSEGNLAQTEVQKTFTYEKSVTGIEDFNDEQTAIYDEILKTEFRTNTGKNVSLSDAIDNDKLVSLIENNQMPAERVQAFIETLNQQFENSAISPAGTKNKIDVLFESCFITHTDKSIAEIAKVYSSMVNKHQTYYTRGMQDSFEKTKLYITSVEDTKKAMDLMLNGMDFEEANSYIGKLKANQKTVEIPKSTMVTFEQELSKEQIESAKQNYLKMIESSYDYQGCEAQLCVALEKYGSDAEIIIGLIESGMLKPETICKLPPEGYLAPEIVSDIDKMCTAYMLSAKEKDGGLEFESIDDAQKALKEGIAILDNGMAVSLGEGSSVKIQGKIYIADSEGNLQEYKPISQEDVFVPKFANADEVKAALETGKLQFYTGESIPVKAGDVIELEGHKNACIINNDGSVTELNISKETYLRLFPPVERFATVQGGIGNCFEIASTLATFRGGNARKVFLSLFNEDSNGDLSVKFPISQNTYSFKRVNCPDGSFFYTTPNGEKVDLSNYSKGALGYVLFEYADGMELQYDKQTELLDSLTDDEKQEYIEKGLLIKNGDKYTFADDVYVHYDKDDKLVAESYLDYKENNHSKYNSIFLQSRDVGSPTRVLELLGFNDVQELGLPNTKTSADKVISESTLKDPRFFMDNTVILATKKLGGEIKEIVMDSSKSLLSMHANGLVPKTISVGGKIIVDTEDMPLEEICRLYQDDELEILTYEFYNPWNPTVQEIGYEELIKYGDCLSCGRNPDVDSNQEIYVEASEYLNKEGSQIVGASYDEVEERLCDGNIGENIVGGEGITVNSKDVDIENERTEADKSNAEIVDNSSESGSIETDRITKEKKILEKIDSYRKKIQKLVTAGEKLPKHILTDEEIRTVYENSYKLSQMYSQNNEKVFTPLENCFSDDSTIENIETRTKGIGSVFSKLVKNVESGNVNPDAIQASRQTVTDAFGSRIILKSLTSDEARTTVENYLKEYEIPCTFEDFESIINGNASDFVKANLEDRKIDIIRALKEAQTDSILNTLINGIKNKTINITELNNYGNDFSTYFTPKQVERLADAYHQATGEKLKIVTQKEDGYNGVWEVKQTADGKYEICCSDTYEITTKGANKKSGYTSSQFNFEVDESLGELQIRGVGVNEHGDKEHMWYDYKQGKETNPELKAVLDSLDDASIEAIDKAVAENYTAHRLIELGLNGNLLHVEDLTLKDKNGKVVNPFLLNGLF